MDTVHGARSRQRLKTIVIVIAIRLSTLLRRRPGKHVLAEMDDFLRCRFGGKLPRHRAL